MQFLGGYKEKLKKPPTKDPYTGEVAEHPSKDLSLVEVTKDKNEHALFYNIFLPKLDKAKAEEIAESLLDKDKRELTPELTKFRHDALEKYNKIRKDVEFVKTHITEDLINTVAAHSQDMKELLTNVSVEQAVKYFKVRRIFEMAIEDPPKAFNQLKKNMKKIPDRMKSDYAKSLQEKIKKLTSELGITDAQLKEATSRDKGFFEVRAALAKIAAPKFNEKKKPDPKKEASILHDQWEHTKIWFKNFWARESLLDVVAREIHFAERCNTELKNIGNILAGTIDLEIKQEMYKISLDDDPDKKEAIWPPNMLMTRKDLHHALDQYRKVGIEKKWRTKVNEYKKDQGIEGGRRGKKLTPAEKTTDEFIEMREKFVKEQAEGHEKLVAREGPTNTVYKNRVAKLADDKKPTAANIKKWVEALDV